MGHDQQCNSAAGASGGLTNLHSEINKRPEIGNTGGMLKYTKKMCIDPIYRFSAITNIRYFYICTVSDIAENHKISFTLIMH